LKPHTDSKVFPIQIQLECSSFRKNKNGKIFKHFKSNYKTISNHHQKIETFDLPLTPQISIDKKIKTIKNENKDRLPTNLKNNNSVFYSPQNINSINNPFISFLEKSINNFDNDKLSNKSIFRKRNLFMMQNDNSGNKNCRRRITNFVLKKLISAKHEKVTLKR